MRPLFLAIALICLNATAVSGQSAAKESVSRVRIQYPSDLRYYGSNAMAGFSLDFVLERGVDFRLVYCDRETLQRRTESNVCIVDFAIGDSSWHQEIKIGSRAKLGAVLKKSGREALVAWNGRRPPIRVIKQRSILTYTGSKDFLRTEIEPGDFIIVMGED